MLISELSLTHNSARGDKCYRHQPIRRTRRFTLTSNVRVRGPCDQGLLNPRSALNHANLIEWDQFIEDVEHSRGQFRSDLALVTPTSSTDTHVDAYHTLQTLRSDFDHYRTDTKTTLEATRSDVKMLLRNIQIKLHSYSLRAYEPPADCDFPVSARKRSSRIARPELRSLGIGRGLVCSVESREGTLDVNQLSATDVREHSSSFSVWRILTSFGIVSASE